ncbi:hypothetical protein BDV18DRAFT_139657 [Aspergillus unguis]
MALTTPASHVSSGAKKKRRSSACTSCQTRRTKCSGSFPCDKCLSINSSCIFDPKRDRRRKFALKKAEQDHNTMKRLIHLLRQGTPDDVWKLKANIESCLSEQEAMDRLPSFLIHIPESHKVK